MNTQSPVSKSFIDLLTHTDFMTKCDKKTCEKKSLALPDAPIEVKCRTVSHATPSCQIHVIFSIIYLR